MQPVRSYFHGVTSATPLVVKAGLCGLVVLSAVALAGVVQHRASAQSAAVGAPASTRPRGKAVYDAHCIECHGKDGKGDGPAALTLVSPVSR